MVQDEQVVGTIGDSEQDCDEAVEPAPDIVHKHLVLVLDADEREENGYGRPQAVQVVLVRRRAGRLQAAV